MLINSSWKTLFQISTTTGTLPITDALQRNTISLEAAIMASVYEKAAPEDVAEASNASSANFARLPLTSGIVNEVIGPPCVMSFTIHIGDPCKEQEEIRKKYPADEAAKTHILSWIHALREANQARIQGKIDKKLDKSIDMDVNQIFLTKQKTFSALKEKERAELALGITLLGDEILTLDLVSDEGLHQAAKIKELSDINVPEIEGLPAYDRLYIMYKLVKLEKEVLLPLMYLLDGLEKEQH